MISQGRSDATTRGIHIEVVSSYVPERSSPQDQYYFFVYSVRISNRGSDTVQLVSRHWVISGPEGEVGHAQGRGVVGEEPILAPGACFEYTSFCPLRTSLGSMRGSYRMVLASGDGFDAEIAPFSLAAPSALN